MDLEANKYHYFVPWKVEDNQPHHVGASDVENVLILTPNDTAGILTEEFNYNCAQNEQDRMELKKDKMVVLKRVRDELRDLAKRSHFEKTKFLHFESDDKLEQAELATLVADLDMQKVVASEGMMTIRE